MSDAPERVWLDVASRWTIASPEPHKYTTEYIRADLFYRVEGMVDESLRQLRQARKDMRAVIASIEEKLYE